jgi:hypothetical protein
MNKICTIGLLLAVSTYSNIFTSKPQMVTLKNPTKYSLELSSSSKTEVVAKGGTSTQLINDPINIEPGKTVTVPKGKKIWLEKLNFYYDPNAIQAAPPITITTPPNTTSKISIDENGATTGEIVIEPGKQSKITYFKNSEYIDLKHKEFNPTNPTYTFDLATNSFK